MSELEDGELESVQSSTPDAQGSSSESAPRPYNDDAAVESKDVASSQPPLPEEPLPPPLPDEALPTRPTSEDDGWAPAWDATAQAYYFYNRFTNATQWENPRIPESTTAMTTSSAHSQTNHDRIDPVTHAPGTSPYQLKQAPGTQPYPVAQRQQQPPPTLHPAVIGGYNPAIHGDYDPNADYAQAPPSPSAMDPTRDAPPGLGDEYAATATFNRFTGRFQAPTLTSDNFNDEAKSKRQMNAFFDLDAATSGHDGRSLRAERASKKLSKDDVKAFKEKRREKKEEKRRAWLRD